MFGLASTTSAIGLLAKELRPIAVPRFAAGLAASLVSKVPLLPAEAYWINAFKTSVVMDTEKAKTKLRWTPKHDSRATLMQTVRAAKQKGLV